MIKDKMVICIGSSACKESHCDHKLPHEVEYWGIDKGDCCLDSEECDLKIIYCRPVNEIIDFGDDFKL